MQQAPHQQPFNKLKAVAAMNDKYTSWYPKHIFPSVPGVYEVSIGFRSNLPWYAYWNGKRFGYRSLSPHIAMIERDYPTQLEAHVEWRGLTKQAFMEMKNAIR